MISGVLPNPPASSYPFSPLSKLPGSPCDSVITTHLIQHRLTNVHTQLLYIFLRISLCMCVCALWGPRPDCLTSFCHDSEPKPNLFKTFNHFRAQMWLQ